MINKLVDKIKKTNAANCLRVPEKYSILSPIKEPRSAKGVPLWNRTTVRFMGSCAERRKETQHEKTCFVYAAGAGPAAGAAAGHGWGGEQLGWLDNI